MSELILTIILAVIAAVGGAAAVFVGRTKFVAYWVNKAVKAAEKLYPDSGSGATKYQYVINFLTGLGITVSDKVKVLIEAACEELDDITDVAATTVSETATTTTTDTTAATATTATVTASTDTATTASSAVSAAVTAAQTTSGSTSTKLTAALKAAVGVLLAGLIGLGLYTLGTTSGTTSDAATATAAVETAAVETAAEASETVTDSIAYTVTYDANGATGGTVPADSNTYTEASSITVLDNTGALSKDGYVFAGWNTAADGSGTACAPGVALTVGDGNIILYAVWTAATVTA